MLVAVVAQGVHTLIHLKIDISASATVSAVRTTVRNILFPSEADMSVSAFSGVNDDPGSVRKHMRASSKVRKRLQTIIRMI
jgi:hypothetical protein